MFTNLIYKTHCIFAYESVAYVFHKIMSRHRLYLLYKLLHLVDNGTITDESKKSFNDLIIKKFMKTHIPNKQISINE